MMKLIGNFAWNNDRRYSILCIVVLILVIPPTVRAVDEGQDNALSAPSDLSAREEITSILGNLPLFFVPNEGQTDPAVLFTCNAKDNTFYFSEDHVVYSLPCEGEHRRTAVVQRFGGGNPDPVVKGLDPLDTRVSYFSGPESEWHTNITPFGSLVYLDIYPGIDVIYRGASGSVKREFVVHPGADPLRIRMIYEGAGQVRMAGDGGLVVRAGSGEIRESAPSCYQDGSDMRVEIPCRFDVREDGSVSFYLGPYDTSLPLVIDPALAYCGYIGGSGCDRGNSIAVDSAGCAYITGSDGSGDVFIEKVIAYGSAPAYIGHFGGGGMDSGNDIAVDSLGNAYIAGETASTEASFPVKVGPDITHNGGGDAFVAKVNPAGNALVYCGYLGGSGDDQGYGIAADSAGNAYITGITLSNQITFPVNVGPDLTHNDGGDAFVAKVNPAGNSLVYCGYLGGNLDDSGEGIAVDTSGNAYITGYSGSYQNTFPLKVGPDLTINNGGEAYIAKVNSAGTGLTYCGYIGGNDVDWGYGIAVDSVGNAYVTGRTESTESTFPVNVGPDLTQNGEIDAFVAKVKADGTDFIYCGYIGGSGDDYPEGGIAVDTAGNAYIAGRTRSTESTFPVKVGPDLISNGDWDAFVAKVKTDGTGLTYCGFIGGTSWDNGHGIAVDTSGKAYVTGVTASYESESFPVNVGPDLTQNGDCDAFVAKVTPANIGLFRSSVSDNWIFTHDLATVVYRDHFGVATDKPIVRDFNYDGVMDRGLFRNGEWILDYSMDSSINSRTWYGQAGDIPLVGDFNNDGFCDRAVFRQSVPTDNWIIDYRMDGTVDVRNHYGQAGDIPVIGDFNNDGNCDRAVFRQSVPTDNWIIDYRMDGTVDIRNHYGQAGDIPVIGDFNFDGITDRAVFRSGEWIIDYNMDGSVNSRPRYGQRGDGPLVWNV